MHWGAAELYVDEKEIRRAPVAVHIHIHGYGCRALSLEGYDYAVLLVIFITNL